VEHQQPEWWIAEVRIADTWKEEGHLEIETEVQDKRSRTTCGQGNALSFGGVCQVHVTLQSRYESRK